MEETGHIIQPESLCLSTKATSEVNRLLHPAKVIELESSLSACTVFLRFVQTATHWRPLHQKFEKYQTLQFGGLNEIEIEALETLQH